MPLLPTAPLEEKKDEGKPDPKADAPGPSGSPSSDASATDAEPKTPGGEKDGAPSPGSKKPEPTKAQQEFEAKLEELATLDLSVKERAKEIDKAKAKLDRYTPIDEHLTKGELREAAKKFFGEKYTAELLLELADDFAPTELSVEDRVKKTLAEEQRKTEEADKKKKDDEQASALAAVETETKAYLSATADLLRKNKEKYPLIVAWDDDPDIDHEKIIDRMWRAHYEKTNEVPDPEKVLEALEATHQGRIKKTRYWPKEPEEMSLEDYAGTAPPKEQPRAAPPPIANRQLSGVEEAHARLDAYEREQRHRELLSYGR